MTSGELDFQSISFKRALVKRVYKNNQTSGKVLLPKDLIGKEVIVLIKGKSKRKKDISWSEKLG